MIYNGEVLDMMSAKTLAGGRTKVRPANHRHCWHLRSASQLIDALAGCVDRFGV